MVQCLKVPFVEKEVTKKMQRISPTLPHTRGLASPSSRYLSFSLLTSYLLFIPALCRHYSANSLNHWSQQIQQILYVLSMAYLFLVEGTQQCGMGPNSFPSTFSSFELFAKANHPSGISNCFLFPNEDEKF